MPQTRIINPFRPTPGAEPPQLIGRENVIADFQNGLVGGAGAQGRLMRITGPRGSGKTALLSELAQIAHDAGWITASVSAGKTLLDDLTHELSPKFQIEETHVAAKAFIASSESNIRVKAPNLRDLLRGAAEKTQGALVTIDEIQDAQEEDVRLIASTVQLLTGEKVNIAFVFAGLTTGVMDLINGKAMSFLQRAQPEDLTKISGLEVELSLKESFSESGLSLGGGELEQVAKATYGYAYLIQLVGFYVWDRANRHREASTSVSEEDVRNGIALATSRFHETVHEPAISNITRNAMEYLIILASHDGPTSTKCLADELGKKPNSVTYVQRSLIQRQIIERTTRGYVDFSIPLLRDYLRDNAEEILERYGE